MSRDDQFPHLSRDADLRQAVRGLCKKYDLSYWDQKDVDHEFPEDFFQDFAASGFLGTLIPEEYGGGGGTTSDMVAILEEVGASGGGLNACSTVHTPLLCAPTILKFGTEVQRKELLPKIAAGELYTTFGVTEPDAGTDTTRIAMKAVDDGTCWRVSGTKVWNTGAMRGDKVLLLARTSEPAPGERKGLGLTLFLVDFGSPTIDIRPIDKIGRNAVASCEVFFDGTPVPYENVLGEVGKGFYHLLHSLNSERLFVAAETIGLGRWVLGAATQYSLDREVFGRQIGKNQGVQHPLAKSYLDLLAAAEVLRRAVDEYEIKGGDAVGALANAAKYLCSEAAITATDAAMQVFGGYSFAREYHVGRHFIEARLPRVAPVNNQMILNYIAERTLAYRRATEVTETATAGAGREDVLRVGQFTGWHGDRADGMTELLASDVDVLTGDYLAELTMLVLAKNQQRGGHGYVDAFVEVLDSHLEEIAARGIKVVTNAGGLDAPGLALAIRELCAERGVDLSVAAIVGDDMREVLAQEGVVELANIDTGVVLDVASHRVLTANAYLGAWPIVEALSRGADIVVCPRTTDASLLVGAAAWRFGWTSVDLDCLAGTVVAGHIIECGAQATGGNFSFFAELDDLGLPGMPIAEVSRDGSAVITKSAKSGGVVSVDTVLAQLFYEVGGQAYLNPDVITDLSSVEVESVGPERVRVSGTRGFAPTSTAKLSLTFEGGYRNSMTIGLTGDNLAAKRTWITRQVEAEIGPPESFDECRWSVIGPADPHGTFEESTAWLVLTVRDQDRARVSRASFSSRIVAIATSSVPGFYLTTPPQSERLFGIQWPTLIEKRHVKAHVDLGGGECVAVAWPAEIADPPELSLAEHALQDPGHQVEAAVPTAVRRLGSTIGTRSGDKAGSANLGAWARDDETFAWLAAYLTVERLKALMPELEGLRVERHLFSNLRGMNFLIYQYLGDGVSACTRIDPQGKGLGEYLGSRLVQIPVALLPDAAHRV